MISFDLQLFSFDESSADMIDTAVGAGADEPRSILNNTDASVGFDFTETADSFSVPLDEAATGAFTNVLKDVGISDNAKANALAKFGIEYAQNAYVKMQTDRINSQYDAAIKEFGGSANNPGEKFNTAVSQAARALSAIEQKVPDIRAAIVENGVDCDVRFIKMFAYLGSVLGEDKNLMTSGSAAHAKSAGDVLFDKSGK